MNPVSEAWAKYLTQWQWDWFATLTFRDFVHPEAADKRFRVFVSKINRHIHGSRWWKHGKGVSWIRALERQRREALHFHALLGGAGLSELRRLFWMDTWNELAGFARIEPPRSHKAVFRYCAKYVTKGGEIDLGGPLDNYAKLEVGLFAPDVQSPAPYSLQPMTLGAIHEELQDYVRDWEADRKLGPPNPASRDPP